VKKHYVISISENRALITKFRKFSVEIFSIPWGGGGLLPFIISSFSFTLFIKKTILQIYVLKVRYIGKQ